MVEMVRRGPDDDAGADGNGDGDRGGGEDVLGPFSCGLLGGRSISHEETTRATEKVTKEESERRTEFTVVQAPRPRWVWVWVWVCVRAGRGVETRVVREREREEGRKNALHRGQD